MFPYFMIFGKMITTYLILSLVGAFAAGIIACRTASKNGLDDNNVIEILLWSAIGVLLGGHLLYGITNIRLLPTLLEVVDFQDFQEKIGTILGGSVFYGGLLGSIGVACFVMRKKKLPFAEYADVVTLAIPVFHGFARIGCFLGGCCYGIESSFGFTVTGNDLVPAVNDVCRFPVQLLESALNFAIFFLLYWLYRNRDRFFKLQGKLILIYLLVYPTVRFFDEFLRGDEIRGFIFGLSTSQFISIILWIVSGVLLFITRKTYPVPQIANTSPAEIGQETH